VPIGDVVLQVGDVRLGFEICEDAWIAERPGVELALQAVDVILNPSASHFGFGKHEVRRGSCSRAHALSVSAYVYANLAGNEAGASDLRWRCADRDLRANRLVCADASATRGTAW
jgi:NAD+ synthase (glutamine-hydrolysing)